MSDADAEISQEEFTNAFTLMDHRACGRLTLDTVYSFTATLDQPPDRNLVRKVYDEFDEDGSGDIDSDEFLGLCRAIQKLTRVSVREMMRMYTQFQYKVLFELVYVEDKAHPVSDPAQRTLHKKDLKLFLDSCASHLSLSSADLGRYIKEYGGEDMLHFADFCELVAKVIRGKPISQVVHAFQEAKRERLEARKKAYMQFEGTAGPVRGRGAVTQPGADTTPKEDSIATPRPADMVETTDMAIFAEAFALMDSRGGGVLSLDNVYEFCEALPDPPSQAVVRKLYNQFDADGSGDIDSDEFLGFCQALEKAVGYPVVDMLSHFTRAMYKRLFELVDEGGDSNARVSKEELKMLLEAISPLLSSKFTSNDVLNLIRDYPGELDFNDFSDVVKKLTVGKSISQVVTAFEEAKRRRKAAKHYALSRFEGTKGKGLAIERSAEDGAGGRSLCFGCLEKDETIRQLQDVIAQLKTNPDANIQMPATRRDEDEPHGDPWQDLHSLNRTIATSSFLKKYPEYVKAAIHEIECRRIREMATGFLDCFKGSSIDTDNVVRSINEAVASHNDNVGQLRAVADVCMSEIREFHRHADELVTTLRCQTSLDTARINEHLDMMSILRERCQAMRSDADWLIDSISTQRKECATKAFTIAPYTNKSQRLVKAVLEVEELTQKLRDMGTIMNMYGSDQLFDLEIFAKRMVEGTKEVLTAEEVETVNTATQTTLSRLTPNDWNDLFTRLTGSFTNLSKNASTSHASKKDKAIMTLPVTDLSPLQRLSKGGAHADPLQAAIDTAASGLTYEPNVRLRSTSPRIRAARLMRPRDAVAHVDRIVQEYVCKKGTEEAPPLPANFGRVEPGSNMFYFGTKKIEVIPIDKFACVKVGGGYLLFDEFCRKYCQQESRRFVVRETQPPMFLSPTATPRTAGGGSSTPRTAGGATPRTPRTLVRGARGLTII